MNKDIIQSYLLTTAAYNYSVYEKRILYRIIEKIQAIIEGKKLSNDTRIEDFNMTDKIVFIPVKLLLKDAKDTNYNEVKKALKSLSRKQFEYEDEKIWELIGIIRDPAILKTGEARARFRLHSVIYKAILSFSKGYRRLQLNTAFKLKTTYAMRLYELISEQKRPISFSIDKLKHMFGVEKKYKNTADFIRRIIEPAKKELYKHAPFSYEYSKIKHGKKITAIKFHPVYIEENRNKKAVQKQVSSAFVFDKVIIEYMKNNFEFSTKEIANNLPLLQSAEKYFDLLLFMSRVKRRANKMKNKKGYIIGAIKNELKKQNY